MNQPFYAFISYISRAHACKKGDQLFEHLRYFLGLVMILLRIELSLEIRKDNLKILF